MLGVATDHMEVSTKTLSALTIDIGKLTRALIKESRNLERASKNGNPEKINMTMGKIYGAMSGYSKKLAANIPIFTTEFSGSIMASFEGLSK